MEIVEGNEIKLSKKYSSTLTYYQRREWNLTVYNVCVCVFFFVLENNTILEIHPMYKKYW